MRIVFNRRAFREIRTGEKVRNETKKHADRIADAANAGGDLGYRSSTLPGRNRARSTVITTTHQAMADNARYNTLINGM